MGSVTNYKYGYELCSLFTGISVRREPLSCSGENVMKGVSYGDLNLN